MQDEGLCQVNIGGSGVDCGCSKKYVIPDNYLCDSKSQINNILVKLQGFSGLQSELDDTYNTILCKPLKYFL